VCDPFFSVVIPTRDRLAHLLDSMQAISHLEYPSDGFELIIVDDGSERPLEMLAPKIQRELPVMFLRQDRRGPAAARNIGAAHARGKYLVFTDDDCRPDPHWLQRLEAHLTGREDCLVAGYARNMLPTNPYSAATQMLIEYMNLYYNFDKDRARFLTSNNIAMSRNQFLEIGGFDSTFPFAAGEDRDFCERWQQRGLAIFYRPDCIVGHAHSLRFASYVRQHFFYGRGAYRFHSQSTKRSSRQKRFEPLSFYWRLILHPWSAAAPTRAAKLSTLMVISQIANLSGYFYESAFKGIRSPAQSRS
jgi:glycosyltransferase involved in cell wall biosynthesis